MWLRGNVRLTVYEPGLPFPTFTAETAICYATDQETGHNLENDEHGIFERMQSHYNLL